VMTRIIFGIGATLPRVPSLVSCEIDCLRQSCDVTRKLILG
jgi:hypothetical protein